MGRRHSIIIEGPDASGKSTLAKTLSSYYGMHAFAAGPKPVDREHAEVCMMYQCAWLKNTNCIWDRFTGISNVCNLPELADEDIPMHAHYFKVAMQDAVIIMCTAENMDDHILEPYETSTDEAQILQDRIIILNNYAKFTTMFYGSFSSECFENTLSQVIITDHCNIAVLRLKIGAFP